jgi:vacuolar-type H+-ATPase subunit H
MPAHEAEGLWSRLRETTGQARALADANRKLAARVASLERQLAEAGGLSDDELVAELPRRMSRALESAQEVASELVTRAKKREEAILQETDHRARAIVTHAEAEATAILRRAAEEAVGRVEEAKTEAQAIVQAAHARYDEVLAYLEERSAALDDRVMQLHREHGRLERTYELLERTLGEAKVALRTSMEIAGPPPAPTPQRTARRTGVPQLYALGDDQVAPYDRPRAGRA